MSNEENVPSPSERVDPEAFQRAARKHNNKVLRKQRLQTGAKIVVSLAGAAVFILVVIWTTQWLIDSRSTLAHPSDRPAYLVVLTAIIGAIFIVGGILGGAYFVIRLTISTHDIVGVTLWSMSRTILITLVIAFIVVAVVGAYLAIVFYS